MAFSALVHSRDELKSSVTFADDRNEERGKRQTVSPDWVTGPFSAVSWSSHLPSICRES